MHSIDLETPLTNEQRDFIINALADKVVNRGLETPAVLFLEMHKPLTFLASQAMMVAMPFLGLLLGPQYVADISKLISKRENIDLLIDRIEEKAAGGAEPNTPAVGEQG